MNHSSVKDENPKLIYSTRDLYGLQPKAYTEDFSNYVTIDGDNTNNKMDGVITTPILDKNDSNKSKYLAVIKNTYEPGEKDNQEISNEFVKPTKQMDTVTQVYIGSLSLIGLFVFFRYMYRSNK